MKMKSMFVTSDGREFFSEEQAEAHEERLKAQYEESGNGIPVVIYTGPDLTEGRHGPATPHYGVVYADWKTNRTARQFATLYAHHKYGAPVTFCMGVFGGNAIIDKWEVSTRIEWTDLPSKVDFVIVGKFVKRQDLYPHKEKFGEEEWKQTK